MSIKERIGSLIICCLILIMVMVRPAHAYLDPGSGSAILQSALAAIALVVIVLKVYWHKALALLGIKGRNPIVKDKPDEKMKSIKNEPN